MIKDVIAALIRSWPVLTNKTTIMSITSQRTYAVAIAENEDLGIIRFTLESFLNELKIDDCLECTHALADIFDSVLDLRRGDSLYFQPNRDDKNSKAIIVRIQ